MATVLSRPDGFNKYLKKDSTFKVKVPKIGNYTNVPLWKNLGDKMPSIFLNIGASVKFVKANNPDPSTMYSVMVNGNNYHIHFSSLVKPGRERLDHFKPQQLGVVGNFSSIEELAETLWAGVNKFRAKFDDETYYYIGLLLSLYSPSVKRSVGGGQHINVELTIQKNWPNWKFAVPIKEIAKDFGEMLGPMWIASKATYATKNRKLMGVRFPQSGTEPLVDYYMKFTSSQDPGFVEKKYSSKSSMASRPNTVKLSTVWDDINSPAFKSRKGAEFTKDWKDQWIYKLVELVADLKKKKTPIGDVNKKAVEFLESDTDARIGSKEIGGKYWTEFSRKHAETLTSFFGAYARSNIYIVEFGINMNTGLPSYFMNINALSKCPVVLKEMAEQIGFSPKFGDRQP